MKKLKIIKRDKKIQERVNLDIFNYRESFQRIKYKLYLTNKLLLKNQIKIKF